MRTMQTIVDEAGLDGDAAAQIPLEIGLISVTYLHQLGAAY
jgi:hypothetical protein